MHIFMKSAFWCLPFTVVYVVIIWLEPLLNTFVRPDFLRSQVPWMPPWIYKVTATDLNCPDASFVHFGGNGTLDSAISNTTEKEKSPNHACDYCIYPITITCVSFAFCVVYLLMLVVAYAGVSVKIGVTKASFKAQTALIALHGIGPFARLCPSSARHTHVGHGRNPSDLDMHVFDKWTCVRRRGFAFLGTAHAGYLKSNQEQESSGRTQKREPE
eukprot:CAMPEP_0197473980 /NCGR_PEP_ID=MMETSP1309-20131121/5423_1 /TAXON_ID=464262 /ORGANISM="Genus nov. species nov., Strain RCC998" /LENGTH=214 /DNA_ID=CAMNT_0043013407 /DNA_START=522 /DNA_END=1165 /DNA_ORIENTATION=+